MTRTARTKPGWAVTWFMMLAALAMAGAADAAAQTGVIRGQVTAEGGTIPLAGVAVELVEAGRTTLTGDRGGFRFEAVEPGEYELRFTLIGHSVKRERARVAGPGVTELVIDLGTEPVALDPLLVLLDRTRLGGRSGSAVDLPGSAHVVGRQAIEERNLVFDDVHQLMREVPGVHVQEEEGYGLRPNIGMRGAGSERSSKVTLMEDGVLVAPAPYSAPAAYYFPVAGRMEALEVRKGSSQIRHGPATVGGALNLVSTSIPVDRTVLVEGAGGDESTRKLRAFVGDASERFGWLMETYQLRTDGFKRLDGGGPTGFDIQDYVAKARVNTRLGRPLYQELELKVGYYEEESDETYLGVTQDDFATTPLRRYAGSQEDVMRAEHRQLHLRHFIRRGTLDLTTTAYYNGFERNWYKLQSVGGQSMASVLDTPAAHPELLAVLRGANSDADALTVRAGIRDYDSRGIQTALGWSTPALGGHALEFGLRYHRDSEDRFQHEDGYAMREGSMVLTSAGAPGSNDNRIGSAAAWSMYVQDRFEIGRLMVSPGLRYESIDFERRDYSRSDPERVDGFSTRSNGVTVLIPGVGMSFAATPSLRLVGGVHRGFAPPGPGADGETEPEFSTNYELGARYTTALLRAEALGFFSDYTNILGAETLSSGTEGTGDMFNGGAVHTWGLELSTSADALPRSLWRLPLQLVYTYTNATFRSDFNSSYSPWGEVSTGDELPYIPKHQLFASAGLGRGAFNAHLNASYLSAMRTVAGAGSVQDDASTDAYLVLGAAAEYEIGRNAAITGGIENVLDRRYVVARRPAGLRPGLPRTIQIGLRVRR